MGPRRDLNAVLLLDKPQGLSSNDALQKVKRIYHAKKAGHTGALDPLATGMLPICFGEATKFSQFLLDADKRYRVIARLGQRTDTSDADGKIVAEREVNFTLPQLELALTHFRGDIKQIPSMFSALKHQGRPLYEYARQGITIEREARDITIYALTLIRFEGVELELEVHCSKGTYIRTIVDDLGEVLGCGAHVSYLRRLEVADFPMAKMVTLTQLQQLADDQQALDRLLLPVDTAVRHFPVVHMNNVIAAYFLHGQPVFVNDCPSHGFVRVTVGDEAQFVGIGYIDEDGKVAPKRLVSELF